MNLYAINFPTEESQISVNEPLIGELVLTDQLSGQNLIEGRKLNSAIEKQLNFDSVLQFEHAYKSPVFLALAEYMSTPLAKKIFPIFHSLSGQIDFTRKNKEFLESSEPDQLIQWLDQLMFFTPGELQTSITDLKTEVYNRIKLGEQAVTNNFAKDQAISSGVKARRSFNLLLKKLIESFNNYVEEKAPVVASRSLQPSKMINTLNRQPVEPEFNISSVYLPTIDPNKVITPEQSAKANTDINGILSPLATLTSDVIGIYEDQKLTNQQKEQKAIDTIQASLTAVSSVNAIAAAVCAVVNIAIDTFQGWQQAKIEEKKEMRRKVQQASAIIGTYGMYIDFMEKPFLMPYRYYAREILRKTEPQTVSWFTESEKYPYLHNIKGLVVNAPTMMDVDQDAMNYWGSNDYGNDGVSSGQELFNVYVDHYGNDNYLSIEIPRQLKESSNYVYSMIVEGLKPEVIHFIMGYEDKFPNSFDQLYPQSSGKKESFKIAAQEYGLNSSADVTNSPTIDESGNILEGGNIMSYGNTFLNWIKANPIESAAIGVGSYFLIKAVKNKTKTKNK